MRVSLVFSALLFAAPQAPGQSQPAADPRDCTVCPELAVVPPGQFTMGSPPDAAELEAGRGESPAVTLSFARPFLISRREITVGEFRRFVDATDAKAVAGCRTRVTAMLQED